MRRLVGGALLGVAALTVAASGVRAQHPGHGTTSPPAATAPPPATPPAAAPRKFTMEELHLAGGVPRGWKFALPAGDPLKGRQLFADLECFKCHPIQGESFPPAGGDAKNVGPELTGMGGQHPAEYFAESILSPNAVILDGPGYTGPDGTSIMPTYTDSLSVTQLVDLVAFLKSLTGGGHAHDAPPMEKTAGAYTVRLEYRQGDGHGGHAAPAATTGHLMVFVRDRTTGEAVPYLPVTATIRATGKPPRPVKLSPMIGDQGLHYGANVTLPDGAHAITLTIGRATVQAVESAKGRFAKPVTVVFEQATRQ